MKVIRVFVVCVFGLLLALFSCEKESVKDTTDSFTDSDVTTATDNGLVESVFGDVENIADQASEGQLISFMPEVNLNDSKPVSHVKSSCATITHDTISSPRLLTIDFGASNCLCNDGKNRRGEILVSYSGRYRDTGSVHTISFNNYFVNDNEVLGSKSVTNNGRNNSNKISFSIEVDGKLIKANTSDTIEWMSSRTRTWEEGDSTLINWLDDVYSITGTSSGINSAGVSYTANITAPLVRALNCRWFESGTLEITPQGKLTRILDYGSGDCDANATVTISGMSFPIVLP